MTEYEITIGYKAVICISVKANSESEAKDLAMERFDDSKNKIFKRGISLQDDNYAVHGVLNMDETWNNFYKD